MRVTTIQPVPKPLPARIRWQHDPVVLQAVMLTSMGFSPRLVAQKTGLSVGQVQYRNKKAAVKCTDYRFARPNTNAGIIAERTIAILANKIRPQVRGYLPHEVNQ